MKFFKKITFDATADTVQQIEELKDYMQEIAPINYTTSDIIRIAINQMYKSNKMDSKSN